MPKGSLKCAFFIFWLVVLEDSEELRRMGRSRRSAVWTECGKELTKIRQNNNNTSGILCRRTEAHGDQKNKLSDILKGDLINLPTDLHFFHEPQQRVEQLYVYKTF